MPAGRQMEEAWFFQTIKYQTKVFGLLISNL